MAQNNDHTLRLIAYFKLAKGVFLLLLAAGTLRLLHKDVAELLQNCLDMARIDPGNKFAASLLSKAGVLDDKKLEVVSALTFGYAAIFLTEGVGLFLRKRWAEWFTVIATGSFIPVEIYEIEKHVSAVKIVLLVGNVVIVWYLVHRLKKK